MLGRMNTAQQSVATRGGGQHARHGRAAGGGTSSRAPQDGGALPTAATNSVMLVATSVRHHNWKDTKAQETVTIQKQGPIFTAS